LLACQHLPEHDAESPDIGTLVHRLAARLLGRHVGGGAEQQACLRAGVRECRRPRQIRPRAGSLLLRVRLGETEIEHLDIATGGELDVGRFEITVNDAVLVSFLERLRDLLRDLDSFVCRDRPALQALGEVFAVDELHRQEVRGGAVVECRSLEAVDVGNVRVVERGEQLRLAFEACQALGVLGQLGWQQLDRDVAAEVGVGGAVHLARAASADHGGDAVVSERLADQGRLPFMRAAAPASRAAP
jgi:hypothetical protein